MSHSDLNPADPARPQRAVLVISDPAGAAHGQQDCAGAGTARLVIETVGR